ncbi:MATE family efflux transporter [Eubacterium aggregans]
MTYALNIIFVGISESVVTAYGLYYKIQQFILFAAFGLRDTITPIISFSHGMRNTTRVRQGIKYVMLYTLAIMVLGLTILEIGTIPLSQVFGLSGETQDLCIQAIHIVSISFLFGGPNIAFQCVFQALDSGLESLIISVCRQFLFVIPIAWIFTHIVIANPQAIPLIWTVFPIAEFITLGIAFVLMKRK